MRDFSELIRRKHDGIETDEFEKSTREHINHEPRTTRNSTHDESQKPGQSASRVTAVLLVTLGMTYGLLESSYIASIYDESAHQPSFPDTVTVNAFFPLLVFAAWMLTWMALGWRHFVTLLLGCLFFGDIVMLISMDEIGFLDMEGYFVKFYDSLYPEKFPYLHAVVVTSVAMVAAGFSWR